MLHRQNASFRCVSDAGSEHGVPAVTFQTLTRNAVERIVTPVAAKSATGFGDPFVQRRSNRARNGSGFSYGRAQWETFGSAGPSVPVRQPVVARPPFWRGVPGSSEQRNTAMSAAQSHPESIRVIPCQTNNCQPRYNKGESLWCVDDAERGRYSLVIDAHGRQWIGKRNEPAPIKGRRMGIVGAWHE